MSAYRIWRYRFSALVLTVAGCADTGSMQPPVMPHVAGLVEIARGPVIYPADMLQNGVQGWSVTDCAIDASGVSHACRIAETSNHGFDAANLALAASLRYRATQPGVLPIEHFRHLLSFLITNQAPGRPHPRWQATIEGCQVWDPVPVAGETASWSGACVGGFAEGAGKLVWRIPRQVRETFAVADPNQTGLGLSSIYTGGLHHGLEQGGGALEAFNPDTGASQFVMRGSFQDGRLEGHGTMTGADGISYDGTYRLSRKDGQGITTFPTGTRYAGGFRDGLWDGQGRLSWGQGSVYQGSFHQGFLDGDGEITVRASDRASGGDLRLKGTWQRGCFISATPEVCVNLKL